MLAEIFQIYLITYIEHVEGKYNIYFHLRFTKPHKKLSAKQKANGSTIKSAINR